MHSRANFLVVLMLAALAAVASPLQGMAAAKTALFLLVVSYAVLLLVYAVNRNVWAAWPQK